MLEQTNTQQLPLFDEIKAEIEAAWHEPYQEWRVDFVPIKRRPRMSQYGHVYQDEKTRAEEKAIAEAYQGVRYECPVAVFVTVHGVLPKSGGKNATRETINQPKKPDVDNVLKAVMDGLNGKAYADDKQVVIAVVYKTMYRGETPYTTFAVCPYYDWIVTDER